MAILLVLTACSSSAPRDARPSTAARAPTPSFHAERLLTVSSEPVRVRIPVLGLDAPVEHVGRLADGTVDVPRSWDGVGWYDEGPRPGDHGPAVLLGHVDSRSGPAVFARLRSLTPGAVVETVGRDGVVLRFRVDRLERLPKARFPTEEVYLPTLQPELRLVTCGGAFDAASGHYVDNVVVYASAAG